VKTGAPMLEPAPARAPPCPIAGGQVTLCGAQFASHDVDGGGELPAHVSAEVTGVVNDIMPPVIADPEVPHPLLPAPAK